MLISPRPPSASSRIGRVARFETPKAGVVASIASHDDVTLQTAETAGSYVELR